jgi:hypothetical protein
MQTISLSHTKLPIVVTVLTLPLDFFPFCFVRTSYSKVNCHTSPQLVSEIRPNPFGFPLTLQSFLFPPSSSVHLLGCGGRQMTLAGSKKAEGLKGG